MTDREDPQTSAMEKRLLALERRQISVGDDLRSLKNQAVNLWQTLWSAWDQTTPNPVRAVIPPVVTPTFSACCSTISPGSMISFTDSIWGTGALTYDSGTGYWQGWLSGLAYPGGGGCAAATIAILYQFSVPPYPFGLTISWTYNSTTFCPVNSTPTSSPGPGETFQSISYLIGGGNNGIYCNNTPITSTAIMSTSTPELLLRTGHSSETITLTFAGSTATNGTSDFASVCSCIPTTLTLSDSVYGNVTLTYDPINQWWIGCVVQSYTGNTNCPAVSVAVQYKLEGSIFANNWNLVVSWQGHVVGANFCPLATTCGTSTFAASRTANANAGAGINCSTANTFTFATSANSPWPGTGAATCQITF
jgi:hypothetical protein